MTHFVKSRFLSLLVFALVLLAFPAAADVTVSGTVNFSALDGSAQDDDHVVNGVFTVNSNLTIQGTVNCNDSVFSNACSMKFVSSGNFEMTAGSGLFAEDRIGTGNGGDITIQAGGNVKLDGPAASLAGAKISSGRSIGALPGQHAGAITVISGGTTTFQAGTSVSAAAGDGTAGTITVTAAGVMTMGGLVAAGPGSTVNSAAKYTGEILTGGLPTSKGGTITIRSNSHTQPALTVTGDAIIVVQGGIPGGGTLTLEGCDIRLNGLVASTSRDGAGARVDIRSGSSITVDGRDVNRSGPTSGRFGVIRADSTFQGTTGAMQADLFAANDITILGPDPALSSVFSVNANGGSLVHDISGNVRVISTNGAATANGNAISASGSNLGDRGGNITVASKNAVTLTGATLRARGDFAGLDPFRQGGDIIVRSYSSSVTWQVGVGDVRPVGSTAGIPAGQQGTITLTYCTTLSTSGTSFPTNGSPVGLFPTTSNSCSPAAPSLPVGEPALPTCNRPPVANNDTYTVAEGGTLNVAAPGVLTNDTDPDLDPITAILVTGPTHASSFTLNANGSFNYVHDGSETTSDSFTYRASDGSATSNIATVNITITPVNDVPVANNDTATVAEGGTINMIAPGVLANDTDPDGPAALTAILVTGPAHASSFVLNPNGSYTYIHDGSETTSDSFTYRASDSVALSNIATVSITITPVNDAPVANNDTYTVAEGGTLNTPAPGVLGNDTDPDSPTLTAVLVTGPAHASSFTLNPNGSFNYVHDGSETTSDSFTYRANDGSLNSNIATVNITITPVNDAPVAVNDGPYSVLEGGTLNIFAPGVLGNDTDPDSPTLTAVLVTGPAHASSFTLSPNGSFNYVHDGSETLTDSFTYRANDGSLNSNIATVTITITPVNDPPTAVNDSYGVNEGGTLNVVSPGVLGNDTDPDSPTLTAILVSGPAHASSFTLNPNGSFNYVHDGSETTSDSFTYRANDGSANSNIATVTITITPVNDPPVAVNDNYAVNEGGTINAVAPGVLGNDTDPDSPTLTAILVSGPAHAASFVLNADGSFTYVHDGSETTSDVFTYKANDGSADSNVATVTITINAVNDAPVVTAGGTLTYTENDPATVIDNSITVTDNDSANLVGATVQITGNYANGQDVLSFTNTANITGVFAPGTGTLTLTGTDTVANYQAALRSVMYSNTSEGPSTLLRTVTWQVNDGTNLSAPVTSTINVVAVNDAPQLANGSTLNYTENDPASVINSVITVSDADSANLTGATIQITTGYNSAQDVLSFTPAFGISGSFNTSNGTLTLSGTSSVANYQSALRSVKYTNTSDDPTTAARTVVFQVDDGSASNNLSNTVISTINVTAVNDAPTALAFAGLPAQAGIPISYPIGKLGGSDLEAGTTITIDTAPINVVNGSVALNANGSFTFTPVPQSAGGTASFQYRVSDNGNPPPGVSGAYVTVSFNVAGPAIYFTKVAGAGNCTLGNECTIATALANIGAAANANIFISDASTHLVGPIALNAGSSIIGQGVTAPSFDALFGIGTPAQGTLAPRPAVNQPRPTLSNSPVTMNNNSSARGFNMSNSSGSTLIATSKSGLIVTDLDITSTAGVGTSAVNFSGDSGTFSFGNITVNGGGAGGGVNFNGTTSASTASFGNVSTTTGDAVSVLSSGTTNFSFGAVSSTTGKAVSVTTATGGFSFTKISANGATKGITVSGLTGSGSFTVNGTGGLCDATHIGAGDCTGGTIQSTTQRGAEFINAANVTLKNMFFNNATTTDGSTVNCKNDVSVGNTTCNAPIFLNGVTGGTTLDRLFVSGSTQMGINGTGVAGLTISNTEVQNIGSGLNEVAINLLNNTGTIAVTGCNIHNNDTGGSGMLYVENNTGTATLNVTSSTFNKATATSSGVFASSRLTANMTVNIQTSTFGDALAGNGLFGNGVTATSGDTSTMNVTINGSSFRNTNGISVPAAGSAMTYAITNNNPIQNKINGSNGITVGKTGGSGTVSGSVTGNTITKANCGGGCDGIRLNAFGAGGTFSANVTGNSIQHVDADGILFVSGQGSTSSNVVIQSNSLSNPDASDGFAINAITGTQGGDNPCAVLTIGGAGALANTVSGTWFSLSGPPNFRINIEEDLGNIKINGYTSGAIEDFISANNPSVDPGDILIQGAVSGGSTCP